MKRADQIESDSIVEPELEISTDNQDVVDDDDFYLSQQMRCDHTSGRRKREPGRFSGLV